MSLCWARGVAEFVAELEGHLRPARVAAVQADANAPAPVVDEIGLRAIVAAIDADGPEVLAGAVLPDFVGGGEDDGADVLGRRLAPATVVHGDVECGAVRGVCDVRASEGGGGEAGEEAAAGEGGHGVVLGV